MRRHNLHTHTDYSDGKLSPEKLVETAKQTSLKILGINDHAFTTKMVDHEISDHLEQYLEHLRKIQSSSSNINVRIGIEIDASKNCGTDPSQLPFNVLNKFDYIFFEYVDTEHEWWGWVGTRNISEIVKVRDKLKVPVGLAHNDIQKNYKGGERDIATLLAENDIFIELCQSEYSKARWAGRNTRDGKDYYQHFSQKLIEGLLDNGVKVVAGSDFHGRKDLTSLDNLDGVYQFIEKNHLQYHEMVL